MSSAYLLVSTPTWMKRLLSRSVHSNIDIFNISQNVQDTVIHLEVDEEQWRKITTGSKRQATWV